MPFIGDENGAAPTLREANVTPEEAGRVIDVLLANVELMLDRNRVHGDLSPYNVLYWQGQPTIIDFPQAIDPRLNHAARFLLERDVERICSWAERCGAPRPAGRITGDLWERFVLGSLG